MCIHVLSCVVENFVRGFLTGAKIEIAVLLQTLLEDVLYHGVYSCLIASDTKKNEDAGV